MKYVVDTDMNDNYFALINSIGTPLADVLDKIRAEIEEQPYVSKMEVLDIIDKYRKEQT